MALSNIEAAVGGRQALIDTLGLIDLSEKHQLLQQKLADPLRAHDSLQSICAEDGIMLSELLLLLKNAAVAESVVAAMRIGAEALPAVMADITKKSVDRVSKCRICSGTGKVDLLSCKVCYGSGKIHTESDIERQKLLGDWMGLGPKKAGVNVNVGVNQNVGVSLPGGVFSQLVKSTDSAAYDVSPISVKEVPHGSESGSTVAGPDAPAQEDL